MARTIDETRQFSGRALVHLGAMITRDEPSQPDAGEAARLTWSVRAIAIAVLLGGAAGVMAALFLTVVEAEGLVIPFTP